MEHVLEFLNEKLPERINNNFLDINSGGCGIFALMLAKELNAIGIEAELAWIGYGDESEEVTENITELVENTDCLYNLVFKHKLYCKHMVVYINGFYIDSTGVYQDLDDTDWGGVLLGVFKMNQVAHICNDRKGWNTWFNSRNIPRIERRLREMFEEFVENNRKYLIV